MSNNFDIKQVRKNAKDLREKLLRQIAKKLYFSNIKNEILRKSFEERLKTYNVVDKREEGLYCSYCKKFTPSEHTSRERVIFPTHLEGEIWIIHPHYDGCRGWD